MGEDTWVYISRKSLREMVRNFDLDYLLWLMINVEGQRWYYVTDKLGFSDYDLGEHILTSKDIMRNLALSSDEIEWREIFVSICEKYDIILWGDYSERRFESPDYVCLYDLREEFEKIINREAGIDEA